MIGRSLAKFKTFLVHPLHCSLLRICDKTALDAGLPFVVLKAESNEANILIDC